MITLEELKIGVNVNWGIETENLVCVVTKIKFWTFWTYNPRLQIRYDLYSQYTLKNPPITKKDYEKISNFLGVQLKNNFGLIGLSNLTDEFNSYLCNYNTIHPNNQISFPMDDAFMIQFDPYYKWATGNG